MNYESGNIYVYLTFRTPADVNPITGLYDFSIAGKESPFGGIYRVNMCENSFTDGMWKQKLKLLRMPGPQGPEVNETITGDKASAISKADSPAVQISEPAPAKNTVVDNTQGGRRTAANDPRTFNNNGASSSSANTTDSLRNRSRKSAADSRKNTTTTSNQAPTVVGFRYYRDLGQK